MPSSSALLQPLPMNGSIISWLVLAISTISIFSDVAWASASAQRLGFGQRSLLLELRNSLVFNASESTKLVQWGRSGDSWGGVTCEDGLVVGLDLSEESISGGIDGSSSLFRLEFLRGLNLAFNDFNSSAIPSGLANLSRLEHLNLSDAGFAGQIPAELSRLTKLRTLDLTRFSFPESASLKLEKPSLRSLIGDLGELRELYLDFVNVSAEGSEWCDALSSSVPKLEVLSMSFCSLSGPIDASLMGLANLSVIQLDFNDLSTTVPSFLANFSSLKTLSLSGCGLQGEFPQKVFQVRTLQTLDLSSNQLLQGSLPEFPENGSLQRLVLSFTNISGELPYSISNLRNLSRIELVNCSFDGNIPSSFTNLWQLAYMDFSFNNFTGSIPSLSKSKNLTQITLSHNNLTGQIDSTHWESLLSLLMLDLRFNLLKGIIPSSLFTLPSIQKLQLSNNQFSGPLKAFFNATSHKLDTLDLSNNNIGGELPMSIWELRGLQYLSLSSNNFSGSFHINLVQQLRNLSYLDLSYNRFSINATNNASQSSLFPNITTLELASCQLRTLPDFLAGQHRLVYLDLSENQIEGKIPKWIWELENLLYLNLSSNLLADIETPLPNLTSTLTVLDLHKNRLHGQTLPLPPLATYMDFSSNNLSLVIPPAVGTNLSVAIFFSLSNNSFNGFIPKSICKAEYLQVLDLSHNLLRGNIPNCLVMESLKVLNLRNNALNGSIVNFPETCGLKTLDLSNNVLRGKFPKSLANCRALEVLDVRNNQIDDVFPCQLKSIANLRVLVLQSNKFHRGVGCPKTNGTWKMLQIVDVSSNNFSGILPAQCLTTWEAMKANVDINHIQYPFLRWTGLYYQDTVTVTFKGLQVELVKIFTIFTLIDFSCNNLDGPIPDTLGDLKALYVLNLSANAFAGPIPPSLGNLQQLESLDLSRNHLNGTILPQLSDLNFLSFLNLSHNKLEGSIPAVKQFLTFSASSFENNSGLCGFPLEKSRSSSVGGNLGSCNNPLEKTWSIATNGTVEAGCVPTHGDTDDSGDHNDSKKKWFYMGIPLGFVVGFWVFCGPLAFIKSWRIAYYRFWDKVLFRH